MSEVEIKLPDIGEGIVEAEISEWQTDVGAWIAEDDVIAVVLTDKAAVEIPASLSGKVTWRAGEPGDMLAVGAPLVRIEEADTATDESAESLATQRAEVALVADPVDSMKSSPTSTQDQRKPASGAPVLAAPAVRKRAKGLLLDLADVPGSGPEGRVTHADLDSRLVAQGGPQIGLSDDGITETKLIGLRRKIAAQMSVANARIPQITIVEEIDVTELERLREKMNAGRADPLPKLTLLPFLIRAIIGALAIAPQINARFDDDAGVFHQFKAVHCGMATQTGRGLVVPVLRHAEALSVDALASEIARLAEGARDGSLPRTDLSGGTITLTSLGPLGAVATTPIINHPEVAIFGINRKQIRPIWNGHAFAPREVMNISASFDHRIVDGWDAATFIARLKSLLETPALIFVRD